MRTRKSCSGKNHPIFCWYNQSFIGFGAFVLKVKHSSNQCWSMGTWPSSRNPEFPESKIKRCAYSKSISCIRILFYLFLNLFYFPFCTAQRMMSQPTFAYIHLRANEMIQFNKTFHPATDVENAFSGFFFPSPTLSIWCVVDVLEEWWCCSNSFAMKSNFTLFIHWIFLV